MTDREQILSPVGRLVQGDPFEAQTKDWQGKPLTCADGVTPRTQYFVGVAFPKGPEWDAVWAKIYAVAQAGFPGGQFSQPNFAWKIVDGDTQADREGYAGHMVVKFSGGFEPKVYTAGGQEIITKDSGGLKRGYFVRVYFSVAPNGNLQMPGVYLNPQLIERVAFGEEIVSGPDGAAVFGGAPAAALPPGASATPLAGAPIAAPDAAQMPPSAPAAPPAGGAPPTAPPGPTAPPSAPPAATAAVTPAPDFLNAPPASGSQPAPAPSSAPAPPPAAAAPQMTDKATTSYAEYIKAGWSEDQLRAQGLMV